MATLTATENIGMHDEPARHAPAPRSRFVPGTLVAGRYRIVALLGVGGMGEVYRAEDLTLGQAVALKFLPGRAVDPNRAARLREEVRVARRVSHPAVCRIHDIGDAKGQPFISMEYVDGEDLASLLRRIGRLPSDKALDLARQLCAGVAAAHAQGILHRDLKPQNVMVDGKGRVRITDFGLAGAADAFRGVEVRSGTPAYMSPEQCQGREVTLRSDLYALGLVLYELFTGRRGPPPPTPALVADLDPAVERVIRGCLEENPGRRPASALEVAAALPGGDLLRAALAAGETPSPDLVAASGGTRGLPPSAARACLAAVVLGLCLFALLSRHARLAPIQEIAKPREVLEDRARASLSRVGHELAASRSRGFLLDWSAGPWSAPAVRFWYREGSSLLAPGDIMGRVSPEDPPPFEPGMAGVTLDGAGRLLSLYVVPSAAAALPGKADIGALFDEAGLDYSRFIPAEPMAGPPFYGEERKAWNGPDPGPPARVVRVEATIRGGRPVQFVVQPEHRSPSTPGRPGATAVAVAIPLVGAAAAVVMARRNLRRGWGDRRGAARLAGYALAAAGLYLLLEADHLPDLVAEVRLFRGITALSLFISALIFVLYLALEPHVRRSWPESLISWNRLLDGRWRDPSVGRDVIVGCACGVGLALFVQLLPLVSGSLGLAPPRLSRLHHPRVDALLGVRYLAGELIDLQLVILAESLSFLIVFGLLRALLGGPWRGAGGLLALGMVQAALLLGETAAPTVLLLAGVGQAVILAFVTVLLVRFGLLAVITTGVVQRLLLEFPVDVRPDSWIWGESVTVLLLPAALAVWGLRASTGRVGASPGRSAAESVR
jgi:serine/threonine-protein kinase